MRSLLSKAYHTARNEGIGSLTNRTTRYLAYKYKRFRSDDTAAINDWMSLRNRYQGERAFLIGNGPSLNRTPLFLLGGEHTMAFNRFDLMLERITWTPDFYAVSDDRVLDDTIGVANDMATRVDHAFFPDIHPYNVDFRGRIEDRDNVHWLFLETVGFSDRLPYCGLNKTVANVGLQILAYLGFTEVYLVGVDMDYRIPKGSEIDNVRDITATEDNDENHFDPRYFGKGRKYHVPMLDETFSKFEEAREFFDERGVRIFNSTKGGKLEVFPRVEFEEALRVAPPAVLAAFVENVRAHLGPGVDLDVLSALNASPEKPSEKVRIGKRVFSAHLDQVQAWIGRCIDEFVPFGPASDRYLFVRRDLLRAS